MAMIQRGLCSIKYKKACGSHMPSCIVKVEKN